MVDGLDNDMSANREDGAAVEGEELAFFNVMSENRPEDDGG